MPIPMCMDCKSHFAQTRGVCRACYGKMRKAVIAGKTTWDVLMAAGRIVAPLPKAEQLRRYATGQAGRGWE